MKKTKIVCYCDICGKTIDANSNDLLELIIRPSLISVLIYSAGVREELNDICPDCANELKKCLDKLRKNKND